MDGDIALRKNSLMFVLLMISVTEGVGGGFFLFFDAEDEVEGSKEVEDGEEVEEEGVEVEVRLDVEVGEELRLEWAGGDIEGGDGIAHGATRVVAIPVSGDDDEDIVEDGNEMRSNCFRLECSSRTVLCLATLAISAGDV